jgi:hypothetical protein
MRRFASCLAILALTALPAVAAPGDQWILGIHQLNEGPTFTGNVGAGYSGPQSSGDPSYSGNSYSHYGFAGDIARVIWKLDGLSVNTGRPVPTTTELYTIEYYQTLQPGGHDDFQPIESQFHGIEGEGNHGIPPWQSTPSPAYDEHIPWVGAFMSNHQWIAPAAATDVGQWNTTGPGPHAPDSASFDASPFGTYMWLTRGSWLYVKWDFPFEIDRSWSAIRLTQVTLDGDHNRDGVVNAADYAAWRKIRPGGDGGYDSFYGNFGMTAAGSGGSAAVPEPAALTLLGIVGLAWLSSCRFVDCRSSVRLEG